MWVIFNKTTKEIMKTGIRNYREALVQSRIWELNFGQEIEPRYAL